jgi:hypothetical protein
MQSGRAKRFAGVDTASADGWTRIGQAIDGMVLGLLSFA